MTNREKEWLTSQGKTYKPEEDHWLSKALHDFGVACLDNPIYNRPLVNDRGSSLPGKGCNNTLIVHPEMARSQWEGDEAAFILLMGNSQAVNSDRFYFWSERREKHRNTCQCYLLSHSRVLISTPSKPLQAPHWFQTVRQLWDLDVLVQPAKTRDCPGGWSSGADSKKSESLLGPQTAPHCRDTSVNSKHCANSAESLVKNSAGDC